ncbi:MAG: 3-hydroxyacyl-CoA dehydrogenase NAD-binding domain-containing protein, partial [Hoeflea sp.]|nr:3-hydroxyacyl-CoA dehydrogenase NAD-binding domain-containing protein [Hoeflea sp.]
MALVTWDMAGRSMNVFTQAALEQLDALVDRFIADDAVKGVVFTSGKSSFSGGADLTMMKTMLAGMAEEKRTNPDNAQQLLFDQVGKMSQLFRKIETCGKPWVSAINGVCMGGAFELSLACHGRVVADSPAVKLALPEVKVGIFPGAGGTQRVPRLTNAQDALQMMTTGQSLTPARAKAMGLVHEVVDPKKLISAAKAMIKGGLSPVAPWDVKGFKLPGGQIWSAQGAQLWPAASAILRRETQNNYPAAAAILKCVFEGLQVPFDTGLRIEQRYFSHILQTSEAQSMIRSLFVSLQEINKGARRPDGIKPTKFRKIGVVGAGFMGAGIAYVTAKAGIPVVLIDRDLEAAAKGKAYSEDLVKKGLQKGKTSKEEGEKLLSLITLSADHADLADADLVIEAVFEDRDVKKAVTESIEEQIRPTTVYASNTSTLPITGLAKNSKRPKNFIGILFFSPVDKMLLVEIILGRKTSDKALAVALDYVAAIKKTPIVVND